MPLEFLMQQMEWREAVVTAKTAMDTVTLEALVATKRAEEATLFLRLGEQLGDGGDLPGAKNTVRKLRFLEKLGEEIDDAVDELEN